MKQEHTYFQLNALYQSAIHLFQTVNNKSNMGHSFGLVNLFDLISQRRLHLERHRLLVHPHGQYKVNFSFMTARGS